MLDRLFDLRARGTDAATEVRAGVVTFLTLAYILFVNPQILAQAGMPAADVARATAIASAIACLAMGLLANLPFALAPGMGLNAYFAFGVVAGLGVSWQTALGAVFVEGLLFLGLALSGARRALLSALPPAIKLATTAGIGLFLTMIGLQNAGLIADAPATLVGLGDLRAPGTLLALAGLLLAATLLVRRIKGALLIAIVAVSLAAWAGGVAPWPETLFARPALPDATLFALDLRQLASGTLLGVVLAFLFVDLLDTAGTLYGVGRLGGFLDRDGELPEADRAFAADAVGTTVGALVGTSTVTSYVESATGIEEGGRSGLTAITVAVLFLLSLVLTPLFVAVPAVATAPALVVVGAVMMRATSEVAWARIEEALPAFLTIALMPFTYSIANGIAGGVVAWVAIRLLAGRWREIPPLLGLLAVLLALYYGLLRAG
ncbi:MAG: NCS2 family permease [Acidobacteria bacterium]|nr:MAG: NCS2 family permease [Acidobacteriota bacterium]